MLQCTISGGRTKGANEKSFVFVHQHGGHDVTLKTSIGVNLDNTKTWKREEKYFIEKKGYILKLTSRSK